MTIESKMFAIAGDPVLHTRSPLMFRAAFDALHMNNFRYLRLSASRADEIVTAMKELPISAFNVTSPFKEEVIPLLDGVDEGARKIGAVNAVCSEKGMLVGYNTDVIGVEASFRQKNIRLKGRKAVVLGAGGAAKAAIAALKSNGADVIVVNRTLEKAARLAAAFSCRVAHLGDTVHELAAADVLVSCLPGGVDAVPDSALRSDLVVLDANYGEKAVVARKGIRYGCAVIDGLEWLISQGVAAFTLFTGLSDPPVDVMRRAVLSSPTDEKSNIALVGFMGAGKSAVGSYLSRMMELPLVDVDHEVEKNCAASIKQIFEEQGEAAFRRIEGDELDRAASLSGRIIACGGGAVLNGRAVQLLKQRCIMVWLWAGIDTVLQRMSDDDARPLLKGSGDRRSRLKAILTLRSPLYADASDIVIHTGDKTPEEIAQRIKRESSQFLSN